MIEHTIPESKQQCRVVLAGNLVAKPEIRYRANPVVPVAEFVMATNNSWFDKKTNSFKDWTTFHTCHFEGHGVEEQFLYADKGQLIFLQGSLATATKNTTSKDFIQVESLSVLGKGVHSGINQIFVNATINSTIKVVNTENNALLTEFSVTINQPGFIDKDHHFKGQKVDRLVHLWGKSGQYIADKCELGSEILIEGWLSYLSNNKNQQLIEAKKVIICPKG